MFVRYTPSPSYFCGGAQRSFTPSPSIFAPSPRATPFVDTDDSDSFSHDSFSSHDSYNNVETFNDLLRINVSYLRGHLLQTYYTNLYVHHKITYTPAISKLISLHRHGFYITDYGYAHQTEDYTQRNYISGYCTQQTFYSMTSAVAKMPIWWYGCTGPTSIVHNIPQNSVQLFTSTYIGEQYWDVTRDNKCASTHYFVDEILLSSTMVCFFITTNSFYFDQPTFVEDTLLQTSFGCQYIID